MGARKNPIEIKGDPFGRQKGEPENAHRHLMRWLQEPQDKRSLDLFHETCGVSRPTVFRWAKLYRWRERANLWDAQQNEAVQAEQSKLAVARARELAFRRQSLEDDGWSLYGELVALARKMAKWPIAEQIVEDEGRTTIIRPAKWNMRDVPALLSVASSLANLGTGAASASEIDPRVMEQFVQAVRDVVEDYVPKEHLEELGDRLAEAALSIAGAERSPLRAVS